MVGRASGLVAYLVLSCLLPAAAQAPERAATAPAPLSRHVILVSIDGLRADAIEEAGAATLQKLIATGSSAAEARTILPSKTLPSHVSMLTGLLPTAHGITWNSDRTDELGVVTVPTVFELAHDAGYRTAAFLSKRKLRHLLKQGTLDEVRYPGFGPMPASRMVREAADYIRRSEPNLLFVHIADVDFMGHRIGWGSLLYRWAVREADAGVRELLRAATDTYGEGNFTVIVTSDHGGHGRDHGTEDPQDMMIPWISYGRGIRAGHQVTRPVRTMDTAATVLQVMGIGLPAGWDGLPVAEAFSAPAVVTTAPSRKVCSGTGCAAAGGG
jgi:predicted AlkP superfamily pyrophosphatase or phosphodiesterase